MTKFSLLFHVNQTIRTKKLFKSEDTIIVALSGGTDSCVLLDILSRLPDLSPRLVAAHINHCLRGAASDADEHFAQALSFKYGIPFESCRIDVAALAKNQGLNLEDAGRKVRMRFLEEIRIKYDGQAIALAHHANDQAETVLMRLLRGSGASGLSGMSFRNGHLIRPLLDVSKHEIEQHLNLRGLIHCEDISNQDTDFLRNRIRHELLPLLNEYNPNICTRLNITASILADEDSMLDNMAAEVLAKIGLFINEKIIISLKLLAEQPIALKRRIFRTALERFSGNRDNISYLHIEALLKISESARPNTKLNLPQEIIAVREYNSLTISGLPKGNNNQIEEFTIEGSGKHTLANGFELNISIIKDPPDFSLRSNKVVYIDLAKAPFPWKVRSYMPGDFIVPLGMQGTKKIKDIFIDKKITFENRKKAPLIFSNKNLIWVYGICISELAKVDSTTLVVIKAVISDNLKPD